MGESAAKRILYPLLASLLLMTISAALFAWLMQVEQGEARAARHARTVTQLATVRAHFEKLLNAHLASIDSLEAFVIAQPDINQETFDRIAALIAQDKPAIREIQLAPDGVVQRVYPAEAHASLGLNLWTLPSNQQDAIDRSVREQRMVIAGPVKLVQGGVGVIARKPVFLSAAHSHARFWGFVTVMLDYPEILALLGDALQPAGLQISIGGSDGNGTEGAVFYGSPELFEKPDAVLTEITLPAEGSWVIAASPRPDAAQRQFRQNGFLLFAVFTTLALGLLAWLTVSRELAIRQSGCRDYLTDALNRRAFEETARAEIARAHRHARPLSLLMLDLDHFKKVNDTWGHAAGDMVLKRVVQIASMQLRQSDRTGRLGGEEFALLLPETSKGDAIAIAERIRASVATECLEYKSRSLHATISIGAVALGDDGDCYETLLDAADRALYRAKSRGRNRICAACSKKCPLALEQDARMTRTTGPVHPSDESQSMPV